MSRRHKLQVDTFPFLAVLLCAMGSLILVLLVMDRRSHLAAQARAQEQLRRQGAEQARALARRREEHEAKRRARAAAWQKKRDALRARATAEEKALSAELREVQERLARTAARLRQEEETARQLRDKIQDEQTRVARQEEQLQTARSEAAALADQATAADKARARLAEELLRLEKHLAELKRARQRDEQTYSVVPYRGKYGDNRRPLYIECGEAGFVLHPDQLRLDRPTEEALRAELARRIARQKAELAAVGEKETRPYLMLLVRPDGIRRFYELQAAARELSVDFGYEFVNADWKFHIPDNSTPSRSVSGKIPALASPAAHLAAPAAADGPALPAATPAPAGNPAKGAAPGPDAAGAPNGETRAPNLALTRPVPFGRELPPIPGATSGGPTSPDAPVGGSLPTPTRPAAPADVGIPTPSLLPPVVPGSPRSAAQRASQELSETKPGQAGQPEAHASGSPSSSPSPSPPGIPGGPGQRPLPLRPAQVSGEREVVIFVECQAEGVVVHPTRTQIAADHLTHSPLHNKLYQTVRQLVARQMAKPGQTPPKVQVRFLIHRDGERTFHRAYPVLEALPVPKSQYHLMPDDDVGRIVAGY